MWLSDKSINRPVAVTVFALIPFIIGLYSLSQLVIDLFPEINFPIAVVMTDYKGVAPQEIEQLLTRPIEESVSTVEGVTKITSHSNEGRSVVVIEFNYDRDMNFAALDIREKLDVVAPFLPTDAEDPIIMKFDIGAEPVIQLSVFGRDEDDLDAVKQYAEDILKPRFESLAQVAEVRVVGGYQREIQVLADWGKLQAYGLSIRHLIDAVRNENLNRPAGTIEEGKRNYLLRTVGEFTSVDDIQEVIVATHDQVPITLSQVARVEDTYEDLKQINRMDSHPSVGIQVRKESGGNTVAVADAVKATIEQMRPSLPPGMDITVAVDFSTYIKDSINTVHTNALSGAILAAIILLLFLRSVRSTIVILVAIPTSIISTFFLMYLADMTLNLISLGGLALGVGMVVDNSIVVLENIYRHRALGKEKDNKSIVAAACREIALAVLASTFTTLAVFFPIIFVTGIAGEIFTDLALVILFAMICSLVVAFSAVPMLAALLLSRRKKDAHLIHKKENRISRGLIWIGSKTQNAYWLTTDWCTQSLSHRLATLGVVFLLFVLSLIVFMPQRAFFPEMDQGIFMVRLERPVGSNLAYADEIAREFEALLLDRENFPGVDKVATVVEENIANLTITLKDRRVTGVLDTFGIHRKAGPDERETNVWDVMDRVRDILATYPELESRVVEGDGEGGGGGGDYPVELRIIGDDYLVLQELAERVASAIESVEDISDINTSFDAGKPEIQIQVDRSRARDVGLTTREIADAIETFNLGSIAGTYRERGKEYDIRVRLQPEQRSFVSQLKDYFLINPMGLPISLSDVTQVYQTTGPVTIDRQDRRRLAFVRADADQDRLEEINQKVYAAASQVPLPAGYTLETGGMFTEMLKAFAELGRALAFAVLLVYLIMAAQFESFAKPFIIMVSVPLSLIGIFFLFWISGSSLSLPAMVGIIVLVGIVVNNAILLIDYANQRMKEGDSARQAAVNASHVRLRPVMMTTLTTVLGMVPLALGWGEGGEFLRPLAYTVIGGLGSSTVFTLIFVPVAYVVLYDIFNLFRGIGAAIQAKFRSRFPGEDDSIAVK